MLPMTTLIPMLAFVTAALVVYALAPQRQTALRARLAPYGARIPATRERLLDGSFVERVLGPSGRAATRRSCALQSTFDTFRSRSSAASARITHGSAGEWLRCWPCGRRRRYEAGSFVKSLIAKLSRVRLYSTDSATGTGRLAHSAYRIPT